MDLSCHIEDPLAFYQAEVYRTQEGQYRIAIGMLGKPMRYEQHPHVPIAISDYMNSHRIMNWVEETTKRMSDLGKTPLLDSKPIEERLSGIKERPFSQRLS